MQQIKPLSLRRNFSWTFIGNAVYAACQWGMLVILAKLGSPEMVGQFTLGLAITAPVIMFTNLQLWAIQVTDNKQEYVFGDFLGLRLIATGMAFAIILGITLVAGYRWDILLVIWVVAFAKCVEAIAEVFYGLLQKHERMDRIAISMTIKGLLSLGALSAGIYLTHSLLWGAIGLCVAWIVVLFGYDFSSGILILTNVDPKQKSVGERRFKLTKLRPRWHFKTLWKLTWLSLPLGIVMMLISLNTNLPRYFIERYLGEKELGMFAALAYLMTAGNMVVNALAQSASARLAKYYAENNKHGFTTLLFRLIGIGGALGVCGIAIAIFAGREILTILYRPEYAQQQNLFVLLAIAAGIGYLCSCLGFAMTAAKYFRIQIPLFLSVVTTLGLGCLWLIPTQGLQGAAIALIMATIVQAAISIATIFHALQKLKANHN
ncbi:MAG: lipopolysaccharide biosynthesis protein [Xenococcaceae cyanobacterium]